MKPRFSSGGRWAASVATQPVDVALAAAVFCAQLALLATIASGTDAERGVDPVTSVLVALTALPLLGRRKAPAVAFVSSALASAGLHALTDAAGPPVGPTLALYWMVARDDEARPPTPVLWGLAAIMLAVHAAGSAIAADGFPGGELAWGLLVWSGAWVAGERTRLRHERITDLEERAQRNELEAERERRIAAAEERARIARELHDSAGHAINVILVHAGLGRMRAREDGAGPELETIEQVARETVGEIDQLVGALRDTSSTETRDVEAPPGLAGAARLVERHRAAGMQIAFRVCGELSPLPPAVDRGAYRILQEALTNAARHGDGTATVEVAVHERSVELTVSNGVRHDSAQRLAGGHGVVGMRERATLLGGSLEASRSNGQFQLRARLPLRGGHPRG